MHGLHGASENPLLRVPQAAFCQPEAQPFLHWKKIRTSGNFQIRVGTKHTQRKTTKTNIAVILSKSLPIYKMDKQEEQVSTYPTKTATYLNILNPKSTFWLARSNNGIPFSFNSSILWSLQTYGFYCLWSLINKLSVTGPFGMQITLLYNQEEQKPQINKKQVFEAPIEQKENIHYNLAKLYFLY